METAAYIYGAPENVIRSENIHQHSQVIPGHCINLYVFHVSIYREVTNIRNSLCHKLQFLSELRGKDGCLFTLQNDWSMKNPLDVILSADLHHQLDPYFCLRINTVVVGRIP